jgi:hypothetical protein
MLKAEIPRRQTGMQKLIVGVTTLVAVVVGFVLFTSLDSPAQENDGLGDTTTTTVFEDEAPFGERFGFGFHGDMSAAVEEFLACLEEQGIEVPDDPDRGFFFDLRSEEFEGLAEALETCGLPGLRFGERFEGELPEGFPFRGLPEDFLDELPDDFLDGLPEDFPFGPRFHFELPEDFLDELPEDFPFGEGFEFHGPPGLDRDALARCLFDSSSLDTFDDVRAGLDECLPEEPATHFRHGPHHFGFDFDEPDEESSSV